MRAFMIRGANDARVEDIDTPTPGPDEVLIRVAYVGICGSDLHYYFDGANGDFAVREPFIPGHELSGTIADDPSGGFREGTPVTVHPARFGEVDRRYGRHLWAGGSYLGSAATTPHTQGAMSEYLIVERHMVRELSDTVDLKTAALAEPLGVALHGLRIGGGVSAKNVLVSGSGPIGLLAAAAARSGGAREVWTTDVRPGPLARAGELGVDRAVDVSAEDLPRDHFDLVIECTGTSAAFNTCIPAARKAGVIAQVGMFPGGAQPINMAGVVSAEVQVRGCFRFDAEIDDAIDVLASAAGSRIADAVVTHTIPLDQVLDAFAVARDSDASGKVLVDLT